MAETALFWPEAFAPFERPGGGLQAREIVLTGMAVLTPRRDAAEALETAINLGFGVALPRELGCSSHAALRFIKTGPETWLCLKDQGADGWAAELKAKVGDLASVTDQTGAYVRVRIEGALARAVLQKGVFLDLDPSAFGSGAAATAAVAHINVVFWRPSAENAYELAVPRSYIGAFRHWLETAGSV
ncbi:MAG: sarcosine oxidase subunit gamma family protein [Caulobacterales bacterium]